MGQKITWEADEFDIDWRYVIDSLDILLVTKKAKTLYCGSIQGFGALQPISHTITYAPKFRFPGMIFDA